LAKILQEQYNNEQNNFVPPVKKEIKNEDLMTVVNAVCEMVGTGSTIAGQFGLNICNITWEDNSRSKNSSWGPCISDLTLNVLNHNLPIIRFLIMKI